jgi:NDP-4-keto-2,6-dideoxyhexose 3-C-methyltransferase
MKTVIACRSCSSSKLDKFLDLGTQYVSDFRLDESRPNKYPLQAVICEDCKLVQLKHTTPSQDMYHENYGFKSNVSDTIKADLREVVQTGLSFYAKPTKWLDIASNDGTLLSFVPKDVYRVGVDPITKYCNEARRHADRIVNDFFKAEGHEPNCYQVVTSISCFYDMDKPNEFVSDVKKVLAKDGVWIIQQNYLLTTLQLGAVDNFCHEHLEYYTLLSLEPLLARHGLEVVDCSISMVNGGSIRTVVAHKGTYPIQDSVEKQRTIEIDAGLHKMDIYFKFADKANKNLQDLKTLINHLKSEGKSIAILAASTRGATIWQSIGLSSKEIDCAIERNPEKVGKHFSALDIPIISEAEARERKFDYKIIGPWFFAEEIIDREKDYLDVGGFLLKPLPEVEII